MLSIILANTVTLIGRPRWGWVTWGALGIGLVLKFFLQAFFWVPECMALGYRNPRTRSLALRLSP